MEATWSADEAILLASSAERVRDYLADRAKRASLFNPVSKEAEAELLVRNDRLR